ncbi:hypothetical protein ABB37_08820 [Leptomonas pyrrhocoris]|uniref:Uncharacterized protein n=1 Tax=Leptomonas pyrrhocoris TaxID=157538 RepID=A0A0N0VDH8_LEPPY|nr:hypothetical protein ABB37_08820 [Leptomonas pyrrhocoris]KPA75158.1 hypothetical protein ABB37_08820 [Leptomonas pyrrhocoris]|eukprot:XP_015653597.1 hypothetical protein ABB37_08820 [Leptomonas pyrrhocoris]
MHSDEYASYRLPSGVAFTVLPHSSSSSQQQQQQQRVMNNNSVLIDPPTSFFVQAQQPSQHHHQQQLLQQQGLPSVFLQTPAATATPPSITPPSPQQQQQRGNSISLNSAQYSPLARQSQPPVVLSSTPPGSTPGQLFSIHPLSPLSTSSGGSQPNRTHVHVAPTPTFAPTSVTQHPQQPATEAAGGGRDAGNSFSAATTMSAASTTAAVHNGVVDAAEMRLANERPFRFKMLPPPPTFDRFLLQWEANAEDAHYRPWRRGDDGGIPHSGVLTTEDALQRSAAAATATVVTSAGGSGTNASGPAPRSAEERLALAEQYRRILERWWNYMAVFEQKPEVRQRLGSLYTCPDCADAQRAVAAGFAELLPGELREQLTPDEVTLQTWSHLVLKWWKETKRRRRTRRSRRCSRKDASSSSVTGRSALEDSQVLDSDTTPPHMENGEEVSVTSGNSFVMSSMMGNRLTHSPPDNEGYLNFDFTNQTTFGSPAESG